MNRRAAPLRGRSLVLQALAVVAVEAAFYASYAGHDARFHWATHLLVAVIATAAWSTAVLLVRRRPARGQVLSLLGFHLLAAWPDLAFRGGLPHYRWMDWVALGHVSSHSMPGGDVTWLVLALVAVAVYAAVLQRWLSRARWWSGAP